MHEAMNPCTLDPGIGHVTGTNRAFQAAASAPIPSTLLAHRRSLLWLGYTFYYDAHELKWGALYNGSGLRNDDLIFML